MSSQTLAQQIARNSLQAKGYLKPQGARRKLALDDLSIFDKQSQIIPLRLNPIQAHLQAHLTGRDLIVKPRQVGISTFIQANLFITAVNASARIGVLAHDDETTQKLRDMQQLFYDQLPASLKPERAINNATRTYYPQTNSFLYIGTAGNTTGGRGGTYSHVHGSEVAHWKDASKVLSGLMQGVPRDGSIILESTANGAAGWFYEQCMAALNGDSIWTVHFYEWFKEPEYAIALDEGETLSYSDDELWLVEQHGLTPEQVKWRRDKIKELTPGWFAQEYPETIAGAFLTSGGSVFGDFHHALYTPEADAKPIDGHYYVAALDFGQSNDYTALSIGDADDNREVYLNRWRHLSWADIRAKVLDACAYWHVDVIYPERNSASSNIENLENEARERGLTMDIVPFTMSNDRKASMVGQLYSSIHERAFRLLNIDYATLELQQFTSKQTALGAWTYGAPDLKDAHDDTVVARMAMKRGMARRI
jgi:hypothetical protein